MRSTDYVAPMVVVQIMDRQYKYIYLNNLQISYDLHVAVRDATNDLGKP